MFKPKPSNVFGSSLPKEPSIRTADILLVVGNNLIDIKPHMIGRLFQTHFMETTIKELSGESAFDISELNEIIDSFIVDKFTKSITILNTGSLDNSDIAKALEFLVKANPLEIGIKVNLIDINEILYKTKELVTSSRTPSGECVKTDFGVKQLKEVGIKNAVIYTARYGGIICVDDCILEKSIKVANDLLNSKTDVTPVLYTSVYEVLEVFTDGQLRGLPEISSPQFK